MGKFVAPKDVTSISVGGQQFDVEADGTFEADESFVPELVAIGCTSAPVEPVTVQDPEELKVGDKVLFPSDETPPTMIPGTITHITKKKIVIDEGGENGVVWEFPLSDRSSIQKQPE